MLKKQIQIRDLSISPPLLLAPMEGLTHSAFRQIVLGFGGIGLLSTEMLSAKRLPHDNAAVSPYLVRSSCERPLSYQLLTADASEIPGAIDSLHELGADAVDINLGCPSPTVGRIGGGIRLMEQPEEVRRIVREARRRTTLPLSAKIRLGAELDDEKLKAFCRMLQDEGIDMLSVHARLKKESFARKPRWEYLARMRDWINVPLVANGGIFSVEDARECLRVSGADGLMPGRGAAIRPWLFAEIAREVYGCAIADPGVSLPLLYGNFVDLLKLQFRPEYRLGRLKQFTPYFAKNFPFGHLLASRVQTSGSIDEARERAFVFFKQAAGQTGIQPEPPAARI